MLDLELDAIVDIAKVKKNREKIADLYVQKGFYLATVDYEIKPVNEAEVDVWFTVDEKAKVKIREVQFIGNTAITDDELRGAIATRAPGCAVVPQRLRHLQPGGVRARPAARSARYYWDRGYANVKVGTPQLRLSRDKQFMYLSIPIDEGPVFTIGAVDVQGRPDRLAGGEPRRRSTHARRA